MRIDYSEPKQAFTAPPGKNRPRKEPLGLITTIAIITGIITFVIGFGAGWLLSQRSAKKSFQAATEQNSLEAAPKQEIVPAPVKVQPPSQPAISDSQNVSPPPTSPEPPLSFYKTLPSGQKNMVLGSGFNPKNENGKEPLQAAIPSNLNKAPQPGADAEKTDAAKPHVAAKSQTAEKPAIKQDAAGFTVQVASCNLKSEAETLKNKLAVKGYNVTIVESNQGDKGIWYRVRIGKKLEQEAAKELAGKLGKGAIAIPERE